MNLILDIGNTRIKLAVFQGYTIVESYATSTEKVGKEITKMQKKYAISNVILSSVGEVKCEDLKELSLFENILILDHTVQVPFANNYKTPKTLGVDRVALVAAAVHQYPQKNVLIIDAGSCVTFDFVNSKKQYFGGAISLGIHMRYKALHTFTANLPKLEIETFSLTGKNTQSKFFVGRIE